MEYTDEATGTMEENQDGSGQFKEVILNPKVRVLSETMVKRANELHYNASAMCFIARSVKFPVRHAPVTTGR